MWRPRNARPWSSAAGSAIRFSHVIRHAPGAGPLEIEVVPQPQIPHTTMSWPVTPGGLCPLLHWLSRRYAGLPIYITENGAAFPDQADASGFVNDQPRIAYLRDHVRAVGQALAEGVDVRGYFVWSLMDNLEWTLGFSQRFGLVRCDSETSQRTIKASGHWYSELISTGRLDDVPNADGAERMGVSL
jgi:beta-glucosidase